MCDEDKNDAHKCAQRTALHCKRSFRAIDIEIIHFILFVFQSLLFIPSHPLSSLSLLFPSSQQWCWQLFDFIRSCCCCCCFAVHLICNVNVNCLCIIRWNCQWQFANSVEFTRSIQLNGVCDELQCAKRCRLVFFPFFDFVVVFSCASIVFHSYDLINFIYTLASISSNCGVCAHSWHHHQPYHAFDRYMWHWWLHQHNWYYDEIQIRFMHRWQQQLQLQLHCQCCICPGGYFTARESVYIQLLELHQ